MDDEVLLSSWYTTVGDEIECWTVFNFDDRMYQLPFSVFYSWLSEFDLNTKQTATPPPSVLFNSLTPDHGAVSTEKIRWEWIKEARVVRSP